MSDLTGAAEAGERLKATALRDFGMPVAWEEHRGTSYRLVIPLHDAPVPGLLKYALTLIGLTAYGPAEKVEWWVTFAYNHEPCQLAFEKFGLRLYLRTEVSAEEAGKTLEKIAKQLRSSIRTVEKVILDAAQDLMGRGNATVVNQHISLLRAYKYFRDRALDPASIEDEHETWDIPGVATASSFTSGRIQMQLNASHDLVAALTAYLSLLEHDFVLALAFTDFDPARDHLTDIIGSRWGEKWQRVLGKDIEATRFREQLTNVVERWRNPYSHGGFEKGHGATVYLHTPGVGALPVGLTDVRTSPLFSFIVAASDTEVNEVFALLDEIDDWLEVRLSEVLQWCNSGLHVRFDPDFRQEARQAIQTGDFAEFLRRHAYRQERVDNMDY